MTVPEDIADAVREAAGGNVSNYAARALRSALLRDQLRTLPGPDVDWQESAEEGRGW